MLKSLRSSMSYWVITPILVLIIASFVISVIPNDGFRNFFEMDSSVAAKVNGTAITERDLAVRFQSRMAQIRRFFSQDIPPALLQNIQDEVLDQLINEQLFADSAASVGLVSSSEATKESIKKQFTDESGSFDYDRYKKIVRSYFGQSTGQFEKAEAKKILAENFQNVLTKTTWVSDTDLKDKFAANTSKAVLSYVELDPAKLRSKLSLSGTEEELKTFYDKNKTRYEIPQKNKLEIAYVSLDALLTPTPKDLEKILNSTTDRAKLKEPRLHAAHILLKVTPENDKTQKEKIAQMASRLSKGESFEDLAFTYSEDATKNTAGDLGFFGPGDMDPAFEKAAMALKEGGISPIVKTSFGYHLIKLYDKIAAGEASVSRLEKELTYIWKKKYFDNAKKVEKLAKQTESTLNSLKLENKPLSELQHENVRVILTGLISKDAAIPGLPFPQDSQLILSSVSSLKVGSIGNPIKSLGRRYMYLVRNAEQKDREQPAFESVKASVAADFAKDRELAEVKKLAAQEIKVAQEKKLSVASIAKALNLKAGNTPAFSKPADGKIPNVGNSPVAIEKAFYSLTPGSVMGEPVQIGSAIYIMGLESKTEPEWSEFEKQKNELRIYAAEEDARSRREVWATFLRGKAQIKQRKSN